MQYRHQLKLTTPSRTGRILRSLELNGPMSATSDIYFMQVDAVRLFHYVEARFKSLYHPVQRTCIYNDTELLKYAIKQVVWHDLFQWTIIPAFVDKHIASDEMTSVLAVTQGQSSVSEKRKLASYVQSKTSSKNTLRLISDQLSVLGYKIIQKDLKDILELPPYQIR